MPRERRGGCPGDQSALPPDKLFKRVPDEHCPTERADDEKHVLFAMLAAFLFSLFTSIRSALRLLLQLANDGNSATKRHHDSSGIAAALEPTECDHGPRKRSFGCGAASAYHSATTRSGAPPRAPPLLYTTSALSMCCRNIHSKKRVESVVKGATLGG